MPVRSSNHFARPLPACLAVLATLAALAVAASPANAQGKKGKVSDAPKLDLKVTLVPPGSVNVDGFVTDWEGIPAMESQALTSGEHEYDWTGPKDCSLVVQSQYDRDNLYLAIQVRDNVVTGKRGSKPGDHVEVWIDAGDLAAKSKGGRLRMIRFAPGKLADGGKPDVQWAYPKTLKGPPNGLRIDGAIRKDGYFFEASIPIKELGDPPPGIEPFGIAVIARDHDYDDPAESEASISTAPFDAKGKPDPRTLGNLEFGGIDNIKTGIYRIVPQARGQKITAETLVDVGGDDRREWVMLVGRYLSISGLGLGDGEYYYFELPYLKGTSYKLDLEDVTGDGKAEMIIHYTLDVDTPRGRVQQELVAIYHFYFDRIKLVFHQELGNRGPGWAIENNVTIKAGKKGKPSEITVSAGKTTGSVTRETYADPDEDMIVDWERILLPWEEQKSIKFVWETSQFIKS